MLSLKDPGDLEMMKICLCPSVCQTFFSNLHINSGEMVSFPVYRWEGCVRTNTNEKYEAYFSQLKIREEISFPSFSLEPLL